MKIKTIFHTLALLWPALMVAQIDLAPKSIDSLLPNAKEIVRTETIKIRLNSNAEGVYTCRKVVTILNNNSSANTIYIGYDPETPVSQLHVNLYDKNNALIRKVKKEEFEDYAAVDGFSVYQDSRVKVLNLNHTSFPYTVEWEYEQKLKGISLALLPDWTVQGYGTAVELGELSVEIPMGMQLHHRSINIQLKPELTTLKDGFQQYFWRVRHLKAIKEEPYAPHYEQVLPQVQLAINTFQIGTYTGSMSSWKDLGKFMAALYQGRDELPNELKNEMNTLLAGAKNNTEKIELLYRYMQNKMRYVSVQLGIGGWQPFTAEYVYRNKYGDCKALTNFMKGLLNYANIKAYPVALRSTEEVPPSFDESFVNDPGFNHVILYIPAEKIWLECTSTDYPINYLGESNADRQVLMITENGGQLLRTPTLSNKENREYWRAEFKIEADGKIKNSAQADFYGANHELYRSLNSYLSTKERKEWLEKNLNLALESLDSLQVTCKKDKAEANMSFQAALSRMGSRSGKRWFIPFNPINPITKAPAKAENRLQRVVNRKAYVQESDLSFTLPAGYKVESLPFSEKKLESPFGQYEVKVQQTGDKILVKRRLQIEAVDLPATEYTAFTNFYREIAKWDATKMVLSNEQ